MILTKYKQAAKTHLYNIRDYLISSYRFKYIIGSSSMSPIVTRGTTLHKLIRKKYIKTWYKHTDMSNCKKIKITFRWTWKADLPVNCKLTYTGCSCYYIYSYALLRLIKCSVMLTFCLAYYIIICGSICIWIEVLVPVHTLNFQHLIWRLLISSSQFTGQQSLGDLPPFCSSAYRSRQM